MSEHRVAGVFLHVEEVTALVLRLHTRPTEVVVHIRLLEVLTVSTVMEIQHLQVRRKLLPICYLVHHRQGYLTQRPEWV